jgi:hypothetical protein
MKPSALTKSLLAAAAALLAMGAQAQSQFLVLDTDEYECTGTCGTSGASGDVEASGLGANYAYVTTSGSTASSGLYPPGDSQVLPGDLKNGSVALSRLFQWEGGNFDARFNYVTTDGGSFADIAWARIVNPDQANPLLNTVAFLFTARGSNQGTDNIVPGALDFAVPDGTLLTPLNFTEYEPKKNEFVNWTPLGVTNEELTNGNGICWDENNGGCGFTGWMQSRISLAAGVYQLEVGVVNYSDINYDSGLAFDLAALPAAPVPELGTAPMMLAALGAFGFFARRRMNRGA